MVLPHEEGEVGLKVYPIPKRFYGKAQERNTASLSKFHCWSPHLPSLPIKNRLHRWRKNWAITQASSNCMISIMQGFSWNVMLVKRHRSWPKDMTIVGSNMRRSEQG